jgi:hypothetical protein
MPAFNFPDAPDVDDTFTVGDKTWKWDGTTWNIIVLSEDYARLSGATFTGTISANNIGKTTVDSAGTGNTGRIFVTEPVQMGTSATGTVGTVTNTAGIFSANVTVVSGSLTNVTANMISTATAGAGNFGANPLKVVSITNATSVVMSSATTFTAGAVTTIRFFSVPSATPVTGDLWFW